MTGRFDQLLKREAGTTDDAFAVAAAAARVCERFTQHVAPVIGEAGAAAIWGRSVHLTERQFPLVELGRSSDDRDAPFARLQHSLEQLQPAVAIKVAAAVIAPAGDLLVSLIGESLTTRLLRDTWPDDF